MWAELLVLEGFVGTNSLDPCKAWVETNLVMVVMSDHELESLFDGLRWFGILKP